MKYNWEVMTEQQKIMAVQEELKLITRNATTKDDLVNMLRWIWDKFDVEKVEMETCNACEKEYDVKTSGGVVNGHPFCQKCMVGMAEESVKLNIALEKAANDAADGCCPHELDLYECEKCSECPHLGELHEDTQRDAECWRQYYLKQAEKDI